MMTKDAILRQAAEVLFVRGYGHTRLSDVASHVGITRPYLYCHFHNKDDLVMQLIDWAESEFYRLIINETTEGKDPMAAMAALVGRIQHLMREQQWRSGCLLGMLTQELSAQNDKFRQRVNEAFDNIVDELANVLEPHKRSGLLTNEFDPQEAGESILAILQGAVLMARSRRSRYPLDQAIRVINAYLAGFYRQAPQPGATPVKVGGTGDISGNV